MAQINSSVSGTNVTFTVTVATGDPTSWGVYVYAQTDHGQGSGGSDPAYPYFVERITGTGNSTFSRSYSPDNYNAELALQGLGSVDFTLFTIAPVSYPLTVTFHVDGNGSMFIEKNGSSVGIATIGPQGDLVVTYVPGDTIGVLCSPNIGSTFIKLCEVDAYVGVQCITSPGFYDTVVNHGITTSTMTGYFTAAPIYKWGCFGGVCMQDATGTYDTQAQCQAAGCGAPPPPTQGFIITADKTSGISPYTANITITGTPGDKVDLAIHQSILVGQSYQCLAQGIILDANGRATVPVQVSEAMTIVALSGSLCSCATVVTDLNCSFSNELQLGFTNLQTIAIYSGLVLAGVYLVGKIMDSKKQPLVSLGR